jgi:hypothetical protein
LRDWHSSGRVKIEGAKEHIGNLEAEIAASNERRPYQVIGKIPPFRFNMPPGHVSYRLVGILAAFMLASPFTVMAQEVLAPVGARVRVTLPDPEPRRFGVREPEHWLVGELVALTPDTFSIRPHPVLTPIAVPRTAVRRLEISRGAPSRWRSAAAGAVSGAFVGLLWGHVLYDAGLRGPRFDSEARARLSGTVFGSIGFAMLGALFPGEQWRHVSLER